MPIIIIIYAKKSWKRSWTVLKSVYNNSSFLFFNYIKYGIDKGFHSTFYYIFKTNSMFLFYDNQINLIQGDKSIQLKLVKYVPRCFPCTLDMKNGKDASGSNIKKINQILRSRPNPVDSNKNKNGTTKQSMKKIGFIQNNVIYTRVERNFLLPPLPLNTIIVIKFCFLPNFLGHNFEKEFPIDLNGLKNGLFCLGYFI